jgi:hypothetical protein
MMAAPILAVELWVYIEFLDMSALRSEIGCLDLQRTLTFKSDASSSEASNERKTPLVCGLLQTHASCLLCEATYSDNHHPATQNL